MGFSPLFYELEAYAGDEVVRDVILSRADDLRAELKTLTWCKSFERAPAGALSEETSWTWYSLGRIYDWLILDTQRNLPRVASRREWNGPHVDMGALAAFLSDLGFWPIRTAETSYRTAEPPFHPFFHEIVELVEDSNAAVCTVSDVFWPGWMWGDMLFARAGVAVRCPPGMYRRELAVQSTMYFAYDRLHRRAEDLSHGWGHNSQWATEFRRDYALPNALLYNVDGAWSIDEGEPEADDDRALLNGLTAPSRIELLRHRSLVTTPATADLYPYNDRHVEPRIGWP